MISERKRIASGAAPRPGTRRRDPRPERARRPRGFVRGYKTAQEVKGVADAKATSVYAKAYGRDAGSTSF